MGGAAGPAESAQSVRGPASAGVRATGKRRHPCRCQVHQETRCLVGEGDRTPGQGISEGSCQECFLGRACCSVSHCAGHWHPDLGHPGRLSAGIGSQGQQALTSLVGLAKWSRDSGQKRSNRAIRGGRGSVRRALYTCAWSVFQHDAEMRRFYRRLRGRGKAGNVSAMAVMRRQLLLLNVVARRGTPWVSHSA